MSRAEMEIQFVNQKKKEGLKNGSIRKMLDQMDNQSLSEMTKPK